MNKKHKNIFNPEGLDLGPTDFNQKTMTMLQFAGKSGKLVYGFESCKKNLLDGNIRLLILTKDIADNSRDKILYIVKESERNIPIVHFSTQGDISEALGLPYTAIIGVLDKNFADKIKEYLSDNG